MFRTERLWAQSVVKCDFCDEITSVMNPYLIGQGIPGNLPHGWTFVPVDGHERYDSIACWKCSEKTPEV